MMIYSCEDHIEEAIEETLTDGGAPPEMEKLAGTHDGETCFLCAAPAAYYVKGE
ncbi:CxxH/CxxC protein [Alkalicoccus urumqiensis]|uniref:CxxH/CxxC protein n=1 Tax=Alkalicoccus urumqiensis TaxID=1548213 RepID=A0A2P6ME45_ALKUR|nr:CxxH/CxxC protein [Alkalicoccus urumqiensis]PRO64536.1 CxxH/CxxC protein [Alkalicoccus urumqiensis]